MAACPSCGSKYEGHVRICPRDGSVLEIGPRTDPAIGRTLDGKYRLDARLGEGGMGAVYRATHVMLGKAVAVKLITPALAASTDAVRRFQHEARAASALNHPHIAITHDFGQADDGTLYMVMELVDGPTLKQVIRESRPAMAAERLVHILRQVASALAFAHDHQVVHRDLKPQNILIARDRNQRDLAKLADFGIAKTVDADFTQLTAAGNVVGTPQYMSPEQIKGGPLDGRSDIYSLGIIAYEMLVGEVPFNDDSTPQLLIKQMQQAPVRPSLRIAGREVPAALEAIILKCLEKDPDARFASAAALVDALDLAAASMVGTDDRTIVLGQTTPSPFAATVLDAPQPVAATAVASSTPVPAALTGATPATETSPAMTPVPGSRPSPGRRLAWMSATAAALLLMAHPATWLFREYVDPPYVDDFYCGSRGVFVPAPRQVVALGCSSARKPWYRGGGEDDSAQLWLSADAARTWRPIDFPDQVVGGVRDWHPGLLGGFTGSRLVARGATDLFAFDVPSSRWRPLRFGEGTFTATQVTSVGGVPLARTSKGWFAMRDHAWVPRPASDGRLLAAATYGSPPRTALFTSAGELSTDGGDTWTRQLSGLPREGHIKSAALAVEGTTLTLLAIWDDAEELGESSTGQIFRREFDVSGDAPVASGDWTAAAPSAGTEQVVHGVSAGAAPGLVWAVGEMVILASQNAGRSWKEVWRARHRYSLHRIVADPQDARTAYVGLPGAVLVTRDMGASWTCSQYFSHACAAYQRFSSPR